MGTVASHGASVGRRYGVAKPLFQGSAGECNSVSPPNGLNNEHKVLASISSRMSERVSPLSLISKRS